MTTPLREASVQSYVKRDLLIAEQWALIRFYAGKLQDSPRYDREPDDVREWATRLIDLANNIDNLLKAFVP